MKTDLENSADVFSFFKENYPLPGICLLYTSDAADEL